MKAARRPYHQHKAYQIFHNGKLHWPSVVVGSLFTSAALGLVMLILAKITYEYQKAQLIDPIVRVEAYRYSKQVATFTWTLPTPTVAPTSTPTPAPALKAAPSFPRLSENVVSRAEIEKQIETVFGNAAETAKKVVFAESSFNPHAVHHNTNGSTDKGLFQINASAHTISDTCAFDARCNIDFAYKLFREQGWGPWYSSKHKWAK